MEVFNPHLFEEPPAGGVTLLKSSLSGRTFPKDFVLLELYANKNYH